MKILSDFDGVWTNPSVEAGTMSEIIAEELRRLAPDGGARIDELRLRVVQAPERHGWFFDGRISSYADEDPFCANNALCAALFESDLGPALRREYPDSSAFASHCYHAAVERVEHGSGLQMLPAAKGAVERILKAGAVLVIVSNSSPDKIRRWFGGMGVAVSEEEGAPVRVRGNAGKFRLSDEISPPGGRKEGRFFGRVVRFDRANYLQALLEEEPDVVIGDNFSLDLALPFELRDHHPRFRALKLVLARTPYTPEWSRRAFSEARGAAEVGGPEAFAGWVEREMA